jgi:uroporphyrinogen-III synthase
VIVTRPEPGASETASRLAGRGFAPVVAPLLRTRALAAALPPPGEIQAILLTSGNAVPALPAALHRVTVLAVGDATAARARAAGFSDVSSAAGDAATLAELAARRCDPAGRPLLLACGRGQGAALSATLRRGGFRVLRRCVYVSVPAARLPHDAARALREGGTVAALFFSAETARAFVRCLPASLHASLAAVAALAISPAAAEPLQSLPWRALRVARRPNQDELLALL